MNGHIIHHEFKYLLKSNACWDIYFQLRIIINLYNFSFGIKYLRLYLVHW
jgi:hypothetical protein